MPTQADRMFAISTPLGEDVLLLNAFTGHEAISQLFRFDVDLLSESDSIDFHKIVGQRVTMSVKLADGDVRYWDGFVSRFSQGARNARFVSYRAEVVPWLWFLTRTFDCRIFQHKNVPDIIQQIFKDLGFQDFELRLFGNFEPRDYCVQYRESDFNFVSRLMEEEGIFYYFVHEDGKHTMVLTNDPAGSKPCPNQPAVRFLAKDGVQEEDLIFDWRAEMEFRPASYSMTDYNFETPSTALLVSVPRRGPYDVYDYPGEYQKRPRGEGLARVRMQEQESRGIVAHGAGDCRSFTTGFTFDLAGHYSSADGTYLITSIRHDARQEDYETVTAGERSAESEVSYRNSFECIPYAVPFRPQRVTAQPYVQGCQTAVVVGPAGEEIHTDKYGRVKVQFFWDREGKKNENSSVWVRVSHPWAGKGWGAVAIPRIGQEVVVDFLEGNPDQPIIIGRVYNAEQMPPNGLPSAGMVSGIKSNSTPGGGGYNEMSMDDTKGKEKVTIHAQYDMSTTVEHDDTQTVHNNRAITVDGTQTETVTKDLTETYQAKHTRAVTGDRLVTVDGTQTEQVEGAVGEVYNTTQTTLVKNEICITSQAALINVTAATSIQLLVGGSSLLMKADGTIQLDGKDITITGTSSVTVKGGIVHSEADSEHQTKGAVVLSEGSASNTVKGGMVMLNP
ncbi:MAG: type VI secretion system tip protein TssI/VgrG [Bryobacteraceae bacterium]